MTTQAIHLFRIRPERNEARFYRLDVWPDLFGGVSLVREWGRIGRPGRHMHEHFISEKAARKALNEIAFSKQKRGYQI